MNLWFWKKKPRPTPEQDSWVDSLSAEQRAELAANLRRILDPKNADDQRVTSEPPSSRETVTLG